ncbi:MAG: glycosyltransferase family 2 protein [candidate division KSB1 bacterium]|nr:glycosyltransferase family 2 protein [candidate division KSB1 bacterium]
MDQTVKTSLEEPLVSVLLPVYNRRHLILRAIDSVWSQTLQDFELLVIDDGSTDGLEEVLLPLVLQRRNLRYLKHANRGLAASRNIGIAAALGKYVTFLDSDDEYLPPHLELRSRFLQEHPEVDFLHGGVELVGPEDSHWVVDAYQPDRRIHLSQCVIGATLFGKKEAFQRAGNFKLLPYSAESEFVARVEQNFRVVKVDFATYRYYTGLPDSICESKKQQQEQRL